MPSIPLGMRGWKEQQLTKVELLFLSRLNLAGDGSNVWVSFIQVAVHFFDHFADFRLLPRHTPHDIVLLGGGS
jgi:hypothetical protein